MKTVPYLVTVGFALALTQVASATPMRLAASINGAPAVIFTDAGTPDTIALPNGTNIGGVIVNGSLSTSTAGAINILNSSSLSVTNTTAVPATVVVAVSGMNFIGPTSSVSLSGSGTWQSTPGSVMTLNWYDDPDNVLGASTETDAPGNLVGTFASPAAANPTSSYSFSPGTSLLAVPDPDLFSMTQTFSFTLAPGGALISRGQTEIKFLDVPEPASLLLLGGGMVGLGLIARRRKAG